MDAIPLLIFIQLVIRVGEVMLIFNSKRLCI